MLTKFIQIKITIQIVTLKNKQYENVDLNPDLKLNCEQDVQSFCRNELKDEVLECLRKYKVKLTQSCRKHVFKIQVCLIVLYYNYFD